MKKHAVVLGCGMVGSTMARDVAADPRFVVTAADVSNDNLAKLSGTPNLNTVQYDLSNPAAIRSLAADADVVLGAMPSRLGFQTLQTVLESGKPYADISFMAEDALELDGLAKQKGVSAVVDCGVSPGLSNLMIGHAHSLLDHTEQAKIYVGGLPKLRHWPFDYKAPFAPSDVIEEYTRPARLVEHGKVVVKPALSEPELLDFPYAGTLEAFNTDGLRSLLKTVQADFMMEKTLRYPGHRALMEVFRETGFFSQTPVEVRGAMVRPLDLTAKLMFPRWTAQPGEEEFTVLRVTVLGTRSGQRCRHAYDLYDETDRTTGTTSMARTTAFPCALVARMLALGEVRQPGVLPPELLAPLSGFYEAISKQLAVRGVRIQHKVDVEPL